MPRRYSMTVRATQAARTRERILAAALATYRVRGISATSLQEVGRRARVSPATVLNHFGSSERLARAVIQRLTESLRIPDDRGWAERRADERIGRLVREMFEFYERSTPWSEVFRAELGKVTALRKGEAQFWRTIGDLYGRVFGPVLEDARLRGAVFGLTHPATVGALREAGLSLEQAADVVSDVFIRLVRRAHEEEAK